MRTEIYIATHKAFDFKKTEGFIPIQVGADVNKVDLGYLKDNLGDNISNKNKNYCELTAVYWMWKNSTANNIGLCHYRRYLSKKNSLNKKYFLSVQDIENYLKSYDVIMPKKNIWKKYTCSEFYYIVGLGKEKDLIALRKIVEKKYPKYLEAYDTIFQGNECSYCNVLVTSKKLFDSYCEWLFDILFELEKNTDLSDYTPGEARIYGYLSELLLNVWVLHNKLSVKYVPLVNTERNGYFKRKILRALKNIKKGN